MFDNAERIRLGRGDRAFDLVAELGVVAHDAGGAHRVAGNRHRNQPARPHRLQLSKVGGVVLDQGGEAQKHGGAIARRDLSPATLRQRPLGGVNRLLHRRFAAIGDHAHGLEIGGAENLDFRAGQFDELPADMMSPWDSDCGGIETQRH
jgi:hypothetical protein